METQPGLYGYQPCTIQYVLLLNNLVSMDTNLVQYNMCCFLKSYVVTAADAACSYREIVIPSGLEPDQMTSPLHHGAVVWVLCEPRLLTAEPRVAIDEEKTVRLYVTLGGKLLE